MLFQSLVRAYKRSDGLEKADSLIDPVFQSLVRAYKRSDAVKAMDEVGIKARFNPSFGLTSVPTIAYSALMSAFVLVSIPRSGLQAFRLCRQ